MHCEFFIACTCTSCFNWPIYLKTLSDFYKSMGKFQTNCFRWSTCREWVIIYGHWLRDTSVGNFPVEGKKPVTMSMYPTDRPQSVNRDDLDNSKHAYLGICIDW